ncbi:MAG: anthranilate phosphoribosyltransferase [Cycloclasticus pugetii]|mgnify:FL=1|jgi:anthranilate phosphoribosyltransferase|uniref:anthranilate phosphoribosyltransferase n=1 Tax=Cycloclasticus TaxID=34067 RepID=UPI000286AC65|nr:MULTISPECIES: anthranilate phosphoribosyltransferase [Cycloclasticus]AFT68032.1 Anthranilate phosphoribosyltransferase [Cycloclasticus sp. P1]MBV1899502.1 anthranilate phosphoribosyltransferase [Cycloclasticus sp.]MDF1830068.1 anthranilate phosphoribosyltransferase [Cycloclasticus pugetii]
MDIKQGLETAINHQDLATDEMIDVMRQIMSGAATEAQIGGFLVALRMKGESLDEIEGAAIVMRELAATVPVSGDFLVDTCGTGGDGSNLFNVSTASAFVVSAAGAKVAKHGNRSVSSSTGSADVLEAAGINLSLTPEQVAQCIQQVGIGFMFAPAHHSAMKHTIGPRTELSQRTIFNMLGPMTNPAGVKSQVIGVFNEALCQPIANVLQRLGSERVLVVHAQDGLDEISLATPTHVAELKNGHVVEYKITPEEMGVASQSLIGLTVNSASESLALINDALGLQKTTEGKKAADMLALNAGAALYVCGKSDSIKSGVALALETINNGKALQKMAELKEKTQGFKDE